MATKRERSVLKAIFRNNLSPEAYADLIESTINMKDDGIEKDEQNGLRLTLTGSSRKLLSFWEKIESKSPAWSIGLNPENQPKGINITEGRKYSRLFIREGGNIGIGNTSPEYKLHVNGLVAMQGRVGDFSKGRIPANGDWHNVLENLGGCQAFEIFAHINDDGDKRYALTYATLLISHGLKGVKTEVKQLQASSSWLWGKIWNTINFRWVIDEKNSVDEERYIIQMKTRTHYGPKRDGSPKEIFFRITKLWDKNYELDEYEAPEYNQPVSERPARQQQQNNRRERTSYQQENTQTPPRREEKRPPIVPPKEERPDTKRTIKRINIRKKD